MRVAVLMLLIVLRQSSNNFLCFLRLCELCGELADALEVSVAHCGIGTVY